jgi:hypothetical protein
MDDNDLERVMRRNGRPVMLAPYGAKIMEIGGSTYLVAATPDELAHAMWRSNGAH